MQTSASTLATITFAAVASLARPAAAQPHISDPMLEPPSATFQREPVVIASWSEALARVRSRSPDYASTMKNIDRAEAQARIALAPLLPTLTGQAAYVHSFNQVNIPLGT